MQSLRNLLQSRPVSEFSSCVTWPTSRSSVTQPLCSTSSVSRILTSVNEALPRVSVVNLPVVSTTMSRVSHNVTLTHSVPTLLSVNSTSRPPSQSLPGISLPTSQQTQGTMGTRTYNNFTVARTNDTNHTSCHTNTASWKSSTS